MKQISKGNKMTGLIREAKIKDKYGRINHEYDYFNAELNEWEEYETLSHCCFSTVSFTDLCGSCYDHCGIECNHCSMTGDIDKCPFHLPTMSETLNSDNSDYYVSEHWDYD